MDVKYSGFEIKGALSGVNIVLKSICRKLGITKFEEAPFQVRMANQRRIQPLGIVKGRQLEVEGLSFDVNFMVLKLEESEKHYPMIMGRPWLRAAKLKQDWGADKIVIRKVKKKVKLQMTSQKILPNEFRPMLVDTINIVPELLEDEEEEFLNRNPSVIPIFEVDVDSILQQYMYPKKEGIEKQEIQTDQELDKKLQEDLCKWRNLMRTHQKRS